MRDEIFNKGNDLVDFTFDAEVVAVFDDMVRRSVPGYRLMIEMVGLMVGKYGRDDTRYYDLGASTGAVSVALGVNNLRRGNRIIAVDSSVEMVRRCRENLRGRVGDFEVVCGDVEDVVIENASVVVLNLTLQFIERGRRQGVIDKIYRGLNEGGVLIVAEKIHFNDRRRQDLMTELHLDFKRANGYSEMEIARKRRAIEDVLVTDAVGVHLGRFDEAGFGESLCYFQCLNFVAFLAVK